MTSQERLSSFRASRAVSHHDTGSHQSDTHSGLTSQQIHVHEKIRRIAKVLIVMECPFALFIYFTQYSLQTKEGAFYVGMDPEEWNYYSNLCKFVASILNVCAGILVDSYMVKYNGLLLGFLFSLVGTTVILVTNVLQMGQEGKIAKLVGLILMFGWQVIEPIRFAFFLDQLPPKMATHQRGHVFLMYQEMKTAGTLLLGVLSSSIDTKVIGQTSLKMAITMFCIPFLWFCFLASLRIPYFKNAFGKGEFSYAIGIDCIGCFVHAFNLKFIKGEQVDCHWMDVSRGAFDSRTIRTTKIMSSLIFIYSTMFTYGMASYLMKKNWSTQVQNLIEDLNLKKYYGSVTTVQSILTIAFLPLIEYLLLPCWNKYRKPLTELQRIGVTLFLTGASFTITTIVQIEIERYSSVLPSSSYAQVRIFNIQNLPANLTVDWAFEPKVIQPQQFIQAVNLRSDHPSLYTVQVHSVSDLSEVSGDEFSYTSTLASFTGESYTYLIGENELLRIPTRDPILHGPSGTNQEDQVRVYLINYSQRSPYLSPIIDPGASIEIVNKDTGEKKTIQAPRIGDSQTFGVYPGVYTISCPQNHTRHNCDEFERKDLKIQRGGVYVVLPFTMENGKSLTYQQYATCDPAVFYASIMLPQVVILSFAEAMGKIPINVFIYNETPRATRVSSAAFYYFFRDVTAIIFVMFNDVFQARVDSFQLVIVTGVHMVFCFIFMYAALRHQTYLDAEVVRRRVAVYQEQQR